MQQFKKKAELDPLTKSMSTNYLKLILMSTYKIENPSYSGNFLTYLDVHSQIP